MPIRLGSIVSMAFLLFCVMISHLLIGTTAAQDVPESTVEVDQLPQDARRAAKAIKTPDEFEVNLFAAAPLLGDPVGLDVDRRGRVFVAETDRYKNAVGHRVNTMSDLASDTLEDRLEKFRKHGPSISYYTEHADRVRMIEDRDGDGRAERSNIFAGGFGYDDPLAGIAADVLAYRDNVYLTCIPHLWRLSDRDGDGTAEEREKMHTGFGIRTDLPGHDMHGLVLGPDGRLYFSVGSRGYNVKTPDGRRIRDPIDVGRGAVFRCELNGDNLEVVHRGLRNPQDLAFDRYGNLFTVDNDADAGDPPRLVYIVEGGDSGWMMSYQQMGDQFYSIRGPWTKQQLWKPHFDGQPAWIVPPIDNIGSGPAGLEYNPGVGLPDAYDDLFFLCAVRNPSECYVQSFGVEPDGASFTMRKRDPIMAGKGFVPIDVEFGYDGRLYVSDWVKNRKPTDTGRILALHWSRKDDSPEINRIESLFRKGFRNIDSEQLFTLLKHDDRRVRLRAHLTLAGRGEEGVALLRKAALSGDTMLQQLHGIWGLGVVARKREKAAVKPVVQLLKADRAQVRARAASAIGQSGYRAAAEHLVPLLNDSSWRVRYFAAQALGKLGYEPALEPIISMIRRNNNQDVYLRHAGVMALKGLASGEQLVHLQDSSSSAVRLAAALALRKQGDQRISTYLNDRDVHVAAAAARAIYDRGIEQVMPDLAALAGEVGRFFAENHSDRNGGLNRNALLRRVINANFRLGESRHAAAVIKILEQKRFADSLRLEAARVLLQWNRSTKRDRILGTYRPREARSPKTVRPALRKKLPGIIGSTSGELRSTVTKLASRYDLTLDRQFFVEALRNPDLPTRTRVEALRYLAGRDDGKVQRILNEMLNSEAPRLRAEARQHLARLKPEQGFKVLKKTLENPDATAVERQSALETLAGLDRSGVDSLLAKWMDKLTRGEVAPALRLDLLLAAEKRQSGTVKAAVKAYKKSVDSADPLAEYSVTKAGGDPARGRRIFRNNCIRCHSVNDDGGTVGPDLSNIGSRSTPGEILESLIKPGATIAKGFQFVILTLENGKTVSGTIRASDETHVKIITPSGRKKRIKKARITSRTSSSTPMPPTDSILNKKQIRHLMSYLKSLQ